MFCKKVVLICQIEARIIQRICFPVSNMDHSEADCFLIVVMSHGDNGVIYARDHTYPPDTLWMPFTGDNCPSLAGKPKLFFIQVSIR